MDRDQKMGKKVTFKWNWEWKPFTQSLGQKWSCQRYQYYSIIWYSIENPKSGYEKIIQYFILYLDVVPLLFHPVSSLFNSCIIFTVHKNQWRSQLWIAPAVWSIVKINQLFEPKSTKVIPQLSSLVNSFWRAESDVTLGVYSSRIYGNSANSLLQRWPAPRSSSGYVSCSAQQSPHNTRQTSFVLFFERNRNYILWVW